MKHFLFFFASSITSFACVGGEITYRSDPELLWDARVQSVRAGNGVYLSRSEEILVASSNLGYISAFGARDGAEVFRYNYIPNTTDIEFISSSSGITFAEDYMVFSILVNKDTGNPLTRVVALAMSGQQLWVSPSLEGLSPGTPVISADGAYVFLTYNSVGATIGHFTILDGATGEIFFSQTYDDAPFAPLGIFHNPAEGYYDGGKNNRNDILVWSVQPKPSATSVAPGATFAFQFPIGFAAGGVTNLAYTKLGNDAKEFQTIQRPVFADLGRSLYWGTTRSQFWCWVGEQGLDRYRFNRARTSLVGFTRGTPAMQAVFAPPALSNDPINRFVFGGTAAPEFVKMSSNLTDNIAVLTGELVKSMAHVSPDDTYVYYLETDGTLHQASTRDLSDNWILSLGGTTEGEFELNKDGTILYVADASGSLQAFRVGDVPTEAPSSVPSSLPSSTPSFSPTETTTAPRTASPMAITSAPVMAPVAKPTATETTTTVRTNSPTIDGNATPIVDSSSASHLQGSYFFFVLVIVPLQWI